MLDRLQEERVSDGRGDYKVNALSVQGLKGLQQAEVGVCIAAGRRSIELDQEIKVALPGLLLTFGSGAEQLKALYSAAAAERFEFGPMLADY